MRELCDEILAVSVLCTLSMCIAVFPYDSNRDGGEADSDRSVPKLRSDPRSESSGQATQETVGWLPNGLLNEPSPEVGDKVESESVVVLLADCEGCVNGNPATDAVTLLSKLDTAGDQDKDEDVISGFRGVFVLDTATLLDDKVSDKLGISVALSRG